MKPLCRTLASPPGFSLIEVLAALGVFGIIAAGLAMNSVAVVRHNRTGHDLLVATTLAQDQIEQLRALDPSTNPLALAAGPHADANNPITPLGAAGGRFTRQWTVTRDTPLRGISTLSVTASWTQDGTRTVQLWTYACQSAGCM